MPLFILMALYCIIGFTGFDPARQDEAYIFGIILEYWRGQSWIVPLLAGEPYLEKPPLYYLIGAACAHAFSSVLPLHDAARLASAFLIAITLMAIAAAGRLLWGNGYGRFTALALLCSLGLVVPSHMMLTDNAQLAGLALALLGFAGAARERWWAGWLLGTGAGVAFLSKGLLGPGLIAVTGLFLLGLAKWRKPVYLITIFIALMATLPWLFFWPFLLYRESPQLFLEWFSQNNLARFFGYAPAYLNAVNDTRFWYTTLWWSSFPTLPLTLLSIQRFRTRLHDLPALQIGLAFSSALLVTLAYSSTLRAIYALPLLLALALMAAPVLHNPPDWLNRFPVKISQLFFLLLALSLWIAWGALVFKLLPRGWEITSPYIDYSPALNRISVSGAAILSGAVLICQRSWRNQPWRVGAIWYSSMFSTLAIFALLWLPILDQRSSYRGLFEQMHNFYP